MKRDELHRRLTAAGDSPAPDADPAFAAALEQRLMAVHHSLPDRLPGATEPRPDTASPAPGRPWFRSPAPVAAALALLAVLTLPVLLRPSSDALELVAAYDTRVTLPDGRSVTAQPGLVLEEGAVVLTGPRGRAEVDGLVLGSGEVAVVQDGELQRVERTDDRPAVKPASSARPSRSPAPRVAGLPALPGRSPRPARPTPPAEATTEEAPTAERPPTQEPAPDGGPVRNETAEASEGSKDEPRMGKAEPDAEHDIGLAAWADQRVVRLKWTAFDHPGFAFFAVLRAPYPAVPRWPLTEGTEVVGYSPDPAHRQFTDDDVEYRPVYRVVALDRSGNELGRSAAVTPPFDQTPSRPDARQAGPVTYSE